VLPGVVAGSVGMVLNRSSRSGFQIMDRFSYGMRLMLGHALGREACSACATGVLKEACELAKLGPNQNPLSALRR